MGGFVEKASGVLGLGRGSVSIVNQLANSISGVGGAKYFSYCSTSESDSDSDVSSKIRFGSNAIVAPGPKVGSTPLRNDPCPPTKNFYSVTLEGVSIGNQRLEYSSTPKTLKKTGNIVIDSSTAMTVLTTSFYERLESALVKEINGTSTKRVPDPRKANGLCYENIGQAMIDSPTVTVHFDQGVDLVLSKENTFTKVKEGVFCLTFLRGNGDDPSLDLILTITRWISCRVIAPNSNDHHTSK